MEVTNSNKRFCIVSPGKAFYDGGMKPLPLLFILLMLSSAAAPAAEREVLPPTGTLLEYIAFEPAAEHGETGTLFIRFFNDPVEIRYFEVPFAVFAELKQAESQGSYYSQHIKLAYERQYGKSRGEIFDSPLPVQTQINALCAFNEECEPVILEAIRKSQEGIVVAAYAFTRARIAAELVQAHRRGVRIAIKMDTRQAEYPGAQKILEWLAKEGIPVQLIYTAGDYSAMHNKFMVFDRRWVITGSYNFTTTAQVSNWENLVWMDSPAMADQYIAAWEAIASDEMPPPPPPKEKKPRKSAKKTAA